MDDKEIKNNNKTKNFFFPLVLSLFIKLKINK